MIITGKARLAGVIGWPVAQSRSPQLHGHWLARYGIDGAYVPLPVRPEHLAEALSALPKLGFAGVNLTVPHKEAAMPLMQDLDPVARRIGAVNTVVVRADGSLAGRNTDAYGVHMSLDQGSPRWQRHTGPAVVLGAGGAARAVVSALLDQGGVTEIRPGATAAWIVTCASIKSSLSSPVGVFTVTLCTLVLTGAGVVDAITKLIPACAGLPARQASVNAVASSTPRKRMAMRCAPLWMSVFMPMS